jgi:chlorite dismutase
MQRGLFMFVSEFKFDEKWWSLDSQSRNSYINKLIEMESKFKQELVSIKRYNSLRYDGDLVYWVSDYSTEKLNDFRYSIISIFKGLLKETITLFSYYKPSPYVEKGKEILNLLRLEPFKYFVAYPMKKSPDWYLLPFEERKEIMDEHIKMASLHPDNEGIRSYTTYSFGIADYEFVVIYEIPDLAKWINVVEKLREAKARKWIVKEEPIITGEIGSLDIFLK